VGTAPGAHQHWLTGLEIATEPGAFTYNLVDFGSGVTADADPPHHLVIDRCYASAGTDGKDVGADFVALGEAVAGVAP